MQSTGCSECMEHELKPIRYQSGKYPRLLSLINRVDELSLMAAHDRQDARKASGIDGVTKSEYDERLLDNVFDLVKRMKSYSYVPQPVRRTYIPKANGKLRPLGIPAYEDRLVQRVMADVLTEVYEPRFLDCSYGFRPGRGAHDVVRYIDQSVMRGRVNYVLEADIQGFFDNVDQGWLLKFLEHDIADKNFLRYVVRFLKAGVMEQSKWMESDKGTPQGGLISPILANVYLHYALDLWVEFRVKRFCKGEVYYARYADDFILLFQFPYLYTLFAGDWLRSACSRLQQVRFHILVVIIDDYIYIFRIKELFIEFRDILVKHLTPESQGFLVAGVIQYMEIFRKNLILLGYFQEHLINVVESILLLVNAHFLYKYSQIIYQSCGIGREENLPEHIALAEIFQTVNGCDGLSGAS